MCIRDRDIGYYNLTFYANRSYYNPSTYTVQFYLSSSPILESPNVTPSSGGWNRTYNYTINVTDEDNDTVNVNFYLNSTKTSGLWEFQEQKSCDNCSDTVVYFLKNYICTDADQSDLTTWFILFNASDEHNNNATVQIIINHTVEKDSIAIYHLKGNDSEVNISEKTVLETYINDTDFGGNTTEPDVYLYVMLNDTDWDSGTPVSFPESGFFL